jgi:hypothetical protein
MKAIKVTTEDGKTIVAGYKDANWISVEYRIYPKYGGISEFHIHAVAINSDSKEFYHEWTPTDKSTPAIKLEAIETDDIDPPLRHRPGTHKWLNENDLVPACTFCNKSQPKVEKLMAGYNGYICEGCAKICWETFSETGDGDA